MALQWDQGAKVQQVEEQGVAHLAEREEGQVATVQETGSLELDLEAVAHLEELVKTMRE